MWAGLYPGQGSQHLGMGKYLFDNFKDVKILFEQASDCISVNMKKLLFTSSEQELALTHNTQPALLLVSIATHEVITSLTPIKFKTMAGHSVGEYSACVASKALDFEDALLSVRSRGFYMQEAVPEGLGGMMAVLGLSAEQIRKVCLWSKNEIEGANTIIEAANYNSPEQTVLSGHTEALKWLKDNFNKDILSTPAKKVKFIPLKVSAPFHCSLMKPAEIKMTNKLSSITFKTPEVPIIQNFTAKTESDPESIKQNIISQISAPVRWVEIIENMLKSGVTNTLEMGAGKVLSGLLKKTDAQSQIKTFNINSLEEIKAFEKDFS